jgi:uncharacterized membrane protein
MGRSASGQLVSVDKNLSASAKDTPGCRALYIAKRSPAAVSQCQSGTSIYKDGIWTSFDDPTIKNAEDSPYAISSLGTQIAGSTRDGSNLHAWKWSAATGMVPLQDAPGLSEFRAWAISDDGTITAGEGSSTALVWDETGVHRLLDGDGHPVGPVTGCNSDCSVMVGTGVLPSSSSEVSPQAWLWNAQAGVVYLGEIPNLPSGTRSVSNALSASHTGSVVGGMYWPLSNSVGERHGFVWTRDGGMSDALDFLAQHGAGDAGFDQIEYVGSVSADGSRLVFNGTDHAGDSRAVLVTLTPADRIFADGLDD